MVNTFDESKKIIINRAANAFRLFQKTRPEVTYDEVMAEGYYIYTLCLSTFDETKGMKFTTYLYMNLTARLKDFYNFTMKKIQSYEEFNKFSKNGEDMPFEECIESNYDEHDEMMKQFFEEAREALSYEANKLLKYIISREWETPSNRSKPTNGQITKRFGYRKELIECLMSEIENFWHSFYRISA